MKKRTGAASLHRPRSILQHVEFKAGTAEDQLSQEKHQSMNTITSRTLTPRPPGRLLTKENSDRRLL